MPTPTKITKFGGSRAVILPPAWFEWLHEQGYPEPEKVGLDVQGTAIIITYLAPTAAQAVNKAD
jgi:antitoxin component of MazEF toxin-antitoxin module